VLEHGDLEIKIKLDDYLLPSQLHGSSICVGLSWSNHQFNHNRDAAKSSFEQPLKVAHSAISNTQHPAPRTGSSVSTNSNEKPQDSFSEQCFDEVPDFTFQANGLSPGTQYSLRIVLYGKN
jgi:hypothetical protein